MTVHSPYAHWTRAELWVAMGTSVEEGARVGFIAERFNTPVGSIDAYATGGAAGEGGIGNVLDP